MAPPTPEELASPGFNKWSLYGFTTTPEERMGPGEPFTYPSLQVNLFFRVFLGLVSLFITWVPARLLFRSGEFAGTVLCVLTMVLNFFTVTNALIWRDDNVEEWFAGYGWCDMQTYIKFGLHTAFNISLFEIMRGLASKVAMNRATTLTSKERRRNRIISAAVIFTVPALQMILTYLVAVGRFNVSTLVGCGVYYFPNWVFLVFFILPTPIFTVGATIMACLTFYRYRLIMRASNKVMQSRDSVAAARQSRVRKKLYFMTLTVIVVVLPLILVFLVRNLKVGSPWELSYDFASFHYGPDPFNQYFVSFTTSEYMNFQQLTIHYIAEITGILLFIPFGTTPEALNSYRRGLLFLGLGYIFPKLREEIPLYPAPNSSRNNSGNNTRASWWSSFFRPIRENTSSFISSRRRSTTTVGKNSRKGSILPTVEHHHNSVSSRSTSAAVPLVVKEKGNPWPDLTVEEIDSYPSPPSSSSASPPMGRNPFVMATAIPLNATPLPARLPQSSRRSTPSPKKPAPIPTTTSTVIEEKPEVAEPWEVGHQASNVDFNTRVWVGNPHSPTTQQLPLPSPARLHPVTNPATTTTTVTAGNGSGGGFHEVDLESGEQQQQRRGVVRVETRIARTTEPRDHPGVGGEEEGEGVITTVTTPTQQS
ncbi:pheromone A receptor-domain-containing protein [Apiosordaria backusii]|uniref:Pheromone A receptor-domain-containing protein n=1 Tax=Apiosordaria backusii TaxID=314023 RepID=A0AA40EZX1_9PEZI|nr:pheromone A receptor-domain-containing protein [Apiosordaria backusii]